jgi:uncharacterized membrane protein
MPGTRLPGSLFLGIVLLAIAQAMRAFALLPARVASSFGGSGVARGWMGKEGFFVMYAVLILLAAFVGFALPRAIARGSSAQLNLPNKAYWLAPERRELAMALLARSMAWFGCGLLLFEVLVIELVIRANLQAQSGGQPRLANGPFAVLLVGFLVFTFSWTVRMILRFAKPN